jgi:hypothetical protein
MESFDQKRQASIEQLNAERMRILKSATTTAVTVQQGLAAQQSAQASAANPPAKSQISPENQAKLDALKQQHPLPPSSSSPSVNSPSPSQ